MNKRVVWFVVTFIGLVAVGLFYISNQPSDKKMNPSPETPAQSIQTTQDGVQGKYVDYADDIIAKTPGKKVLFFHAAWCPQCRAIEADIKRESVPSGLTIIKVDYDTHQDLRKKYGITLQTTFIKIDDSGNAIADKYVAYNEPTFTAVKRDYL